MAHSPVAIGRVGGPLAALAVTAPIAAAFAAVLWRGGGAMTLGPSGWAALNFTVTQAALSAALSVLIAIPLARALARRRFPGRALLVTLLGAPFILPVIVAVLGLIAVFGRAGWVSLALQSVGFAPVSIYGLTGVVLAHVFFNLPLATRLILHGWDSVPAERFRLTAQLGLTPVQTFTVLEWPLLCRTVPGAFALIFAVCLTSFAVALTLGGGPRATTLELAIYEAFRFEFDLPRAAGLSLIQLALAGAAALVALWLAPAMPRAGGMGRAVHRFDAPGGWRRAADSGLITLGAAFLLLPLAALVLRGAPALFSLPSSVWQAAFTSVQIACVSTVLMVAIALPMAGWIASAKRGGAEALGLLGLAASPLTIGTGWFILLHPWTDPAAWTVPVTALVNAMMALPFALRALVPALRAGIADHGRLAASLGLTGWRYWVSVALPLARPQLGFAAGLCAALSIGDLGVVALFAATDQASLPLQMARLMGAYRMEDAAGAALVLMALAFTAFWACDRWGHAAR
ncbi:MAG: thiamine/thiamine pyrophosphate ABC transporter permease ThiP [Pseudomonadota bacterium]